jgi:hypothetical protein
MSPYFIQRMVLPKIWRTKDKTRLLGAFEKEIMHANRDDGQWTWRSLSTSPKRSHLAEPLAG